MKKAIKTVVIGFIGYVAVSVVYSLIVEAHSMP